MRNNKLWQLAALLVCSAMAAMSSCSSVGNQSNGGTTSGKADLVVYGKIYTAEDNKIVEAFAVKDGKYVYVGDKAGAKEVATGLECGISLVNFNDIQVGDIIETFTEIEVEQKL